MACALRDHRVRPDSPCVDGDHWARPRYSNPGLAWRPRHVRLCAPAGCLCRVPVCHNVQLSASLRVRVRNKRAERLAARAPKRRKHHV